MASDLMDDAFEMSGYNPDAMDKVIHQSEAFSEFGGSASFGFAEKAVEMADGIESARKAYFGDGMFGLEQHTCRNAKTIINEIAIWSASCFVFKET